MQFIRERIAGQFADKANGRLFEALGEAFKPVIYGAAQELYKYLPADLAERKVRGDLFVTPSRDIYYYCFSQDCNSLVAGAVCNSVRARSDWGKFRSAISKVIGSEAWNPEPCASEAFKALSEEAQPLVINEWERRSAVALQRPELRAMLKLIASKGSVSLQDVAGDRDMFTVSEDVRLLEELSIITREYVVYCVETDQKVSCVSNFAAIEEAAQRGFKCFHCGRPISQEKVVQILSITESGRRLATKNMWLAYLVGATLCDEGVAPESLLIRSEHNDEIVEVFANVQGSMLMYEVSEQDITADVAFRFLNRTRFFNPQWAYLVTPQAVGNDAQAVIASASDKLAFISDLQQLPETVRQSVLKAGQKILGDLLASFNGLTELEIGSWASAYLLCKREKCQPVDDGAVAPPEPEPSEVIIETPEAQAAHEPSAEEAEPVLAKNEEPSQEIKAEEPVAAPSQTSGEVDVAPEPVIPALAHASINSEGNNCYKVLQQVLDLLPGACASTEFEDVSALIDEVADLSDFSMMIANPDGTPFLGCLDTASDSDLVAALQTDLTQGLNSIAAENNLGSLASVLLCNKEATMRVYVSTDEFNVLAHRLVPEVAEVKAERKRTTPKLKKALQSLTGLPGVNGSMVVREDGTLVQSFGFNGTDSEQITALASCSAQMVNETIQGFCAEVSFNDLRAAIICTDKAVFHILMLEGSYYLVTELNTKVADYVWSSDLSEEAGMVLANL